MVGSLAIYDSTLYVVTFPLSLTEVMAPFRFVLTPLISDDVENDAVWTPTKPGELPSVPLESKRVSTLGEFCKLGNCEIYIIDIMVEL